LEEYGQTYESYIVENVTEEPKLKTFRRYWKSYQRIWDTTEKWYDMGSL